MDIAAPRGNGSLQPAVEMAMERDIAHFKVMMGDQANSAALAAFFAGRL